MRNVILIGDSIRGQYQPFVTENLRGMADVSSPAPGGTSRNVLAHLDQWAPNCPADVIHLNCGLHDVARFAEQNLQVQIPFAEYVANMRAIFTTITEQCRATLIWARTTPVIAEFHNLTKDRWRLNADIANYNAAADALAHEFGLPIHDLHSIVMSSGPRNMLTEDGVHYNDAGAEMLGAAVTRYLWRYL